MDWKNKIFEEKSFLSAYLKARTVASAASNTRVSFLAFLLTLLYVLINLKSGLAYMPYESLVTTIRTIGDTGFVFTTSILGFLIAGFAIFASVTKPELFVVLAQLPHKKSDITQLQFVFFNFLLVFIHYILFLAVCVAMKIGLASGGPFAGVLRLIADTEPVVITYVGSLLLALIVAWFVFLLMLLKSFVWNIYQAVLLAIAAEAELKEQAEKR